VEKEGNRLSREMRCAVEKRCSVGGDGARSLGKIAGELPVSADRLLIPADGAAAEDGWPNHLCQVRRACIRVLRERLAVIGCVLSAWSSVVRPL
jgi:hypothetical protein